jgi:hypothetical protein
MNTDVPTPPTTTDPIRNGTHPPSAVRPELPPPELFEREPDGIGPLSDDLRAALADLSWINDEVNDGRLLEYAGKHVAVVNRQVLDQGDSPLGLAQKVATAHGLSLCRVAVSYID